MTDTSPAFTLDAHRIFRAMTIARAEPVREYLGSVHIEPIEEGGVWMIATNGLIMLIQRDGDGHADHPVTLAVTEPRIMDDDPDHAEQIDGDMWCGARIHVPALTCEDVVAAPVIWGKMKAPGLHVLIERMPDYYPD